MSNPWEEPIVLESSGAVIPVTATRDANGNVMGLSAGGEIINTPLQIGAALNSAIAALPETGGLIKFAAGVFDISETINIGMKQNVTIEGSGLATVLKAAPGLNTDIISVGDATDHMTLTSGFTIRSLKIDGNKDNQTASIDVGSPQQAGPHGIFLHACENVRIEDVEITNCYDSGLRHQGLVSGGYSRGIWLINVNAHHNGNWGVELTQRFRQVTVENMLCDYNDGGGLYADHSEANYDSVICRKNGGHGIWIHNVQRCSYRGLHSYNNKKLGIYVERMVDSTGENWMSHNNGEDSFNPADIYFEATSTAGYGRTRNTTITGIWCGAAQTDSTSEENTIYEDYGINFQSGAQNFTDVNLLDVHIGETNVAPILYGGGAMPGVKIVGAKRPSESTYEIFATEETMPRQMVSSAALAPGSGGMRLMYFTANNYGTYTQIKIPSGSTESGTPTLVRLGIYSVANDGTLTLIGSTANDTSVLSTANTVYTVALSAAVNLSAGKIYALGVLQVATTASKLVGALGVSAMNNLNSRLPRVSATLTGLSDLPSSIADGDLTNQNDRIYAVLLP